MRRWCADPRSERGGLTLWILLMIPMLFAFVGISFDAGAMLAARREADNISASAARAAAQRVTESSLYSFEENGHVSIDRTAAREIVDQLANAFGVENVELDYQSATANADDVVTVSLTKPVSPRFLGIFGMGTVDIAGSATVRVRSAITADDFNVRCFDNVDGGC